MIEVLKLLVEQTWSDTAAQQSVGIDPLERLFLAAIRDADRAVVDSSDLLRHFGVSESSLTLNELWRHLQEAIAKVDHNFSRTHPALDVILSDGPLARRIADRLPASPSLEDIRVVYRQLAECLATGTLFR